MVQTNYEGLLTVNGAPVGKELNESYDKDKLRSGGFFDQNNYSQKFGSVVVVIATDAPVGYRNLRRAAVRSALGLARTGFVSQNQSGDYFIAFSTAVESRLEFSPKKSRAPEELRNDAMNPLFLGVIEATEEAVYNSLFRATTMKGRNGRVVEALPIEPTREILRKHNAI